MNAYIYLVTEWLKDDAQSRLCNADICYVNYVCKIFDKNAEVNLESVRLTNLHLTFFIAFAKDFLCSTLYSIKQPL